MQQDEPNDDYFNVRNSLNVKLCWFFCIFSIFHKKTARADETLPSDGKSVEKITISSDRVNVFTDIQSLKSNLTDERFIIVDDIEKADIRFLMNHFKDYK